MFSLKNLLFLGLVRVPHLVDEVVTVAMYLVIASTGIAKSMSDFLCF